MKTKSLVLLICLSSSCANLPTLNKIESCSFPMDKNYPGGLVNYYLKSSDSDLKNKLQMGNLKFTICRDDDFNANILVPIPLTYSKNKIEVILNNELIDSIDIENKFYRESRIQIQNKDLVNPPSSMQERIEREYLQGLTAKNTLSSSDLKQTKMVIPVIGITSSEFGVRRFINGKPRNRHIGLDIAANEGEPIRTPLDGKVILIGNFFYKGNVVYLDHGNGLVSSYSHMSKEAVVMNQSLIAGEVLGYVGSTGRVTGPHLHWEVYFLGIPINPEIFVN